MKQPHKYKQLLLYAGPFPALAFFKIWAASSPSPGTLTVVAFCMLAFCAIMIFVAYQWDKPSYFDWTIGVYFALISISLTAWPDAASRLLSQYSVTGIYTCLFIASFLPPLLGMDPFTYHYAKKSTPEVVWSNPIFVRINRIMTYSWTGIFALSAALSLYPSIITRAFLPLGIILGFGLPFNIRFPNFYLRRLGLPTLKEQKEMALGVAPLTGSGNSAPMDVQLIGSAKSEETGPATINPRFERKENTMKILALNSSPRGEGQSKTELMLNHLVLGMREAGAQIEVVDLCKKTVRNCAGCFTCWTKTPGVCVHKDDMTNELFEKFIGSDLVVYGTPLYNFTVNATMKAFIERTLPILQPFFEAKGDATIHPLRHQIPKAVVLSVAGFPEMSVFDQLSSWVHFIFGRTGNLVAEIYRPAAEIMSVPIFEDKVRQILEATRKAGQEIVHSMKISDETLALITQDIVTDKEVLRKIANLSWKSCIAEGVTPKEFAEKGLIPRPDSVETFMMILPLGFNPAGAGDTKAVIQFNFSGDVQGACHFRIENETISAIHGSAKSPELTIDSPFDVWMDIMTGKADGQQMFMSQGYTVKGDLSLLMRMNQIFGKQG
jgi:multimeric flavodoxin WrbA